MECGQNQLTMTFADDVGDDQNEQTRVIAQETGNDDRLTINTSHSLYSTLPFPCPTATICIELFYGIANASAEPGEEVE